MAKSSFDLPHLHGKHAVPERTEGPRCIIAKAILPDDPSLGPLAIDPVAEITALADTAGVEVVDAVLQRRSQPHPTTYLGKGKLNELKEKLGTTRAEILLVDDPLSPRQGRAIEDATGVRVVDRTELIMDIFATRARTHQAKLQVELAQLRYSQTRLKRMWTHLSRFEGGIGMRGPGETQIETDRRIIRRKIQVLEGRLRAIEKQVAVQHKAREEAFQVALVGYTNAGKSTLMRRLTGADVLVENRLFSTLDTSTRRWELDCARDVILSDTVGFIRKLPPTLVASFHATLMEATEADLLLHVVDGSSPQVELDIEAVEATLDTIGCGDQRRLLLFNKVDLLPEERRIDLQYLLARHEESFVVSAADGTGIDLVTECILAIIQGDERELEIRLPFSRGDLLARLREVGTVLAERYDENGVVVDVRLGPREHERLRILLEKSGIHDALTIL